MIPKGAVDGASLPVVIPLGAVNSTSLLSSFPQVLSKVLNKGLVIPKGAVRRASLSFSFPRVLLKVRHCPYHFLSSVENCSCYSPITSESMLLPTSFPGFCPNCVTDLVNPWESVESA